MSGRARAALLNLSLLLVSLGLAFLALEAALGLITLLGTITVIQRILHTRTQARQQEHAQAAAEALARQR